MAVDGSSPRRGREPLKLRNRVVDATPVGETLPVVTRRATQTNVATAAKRSRSVGPTEDRAGGSPNTRARTKARTTPAEHDSSHDTPHTPHAEHDSSHDTPHARTPSSPCHSSPTPAKRACRSQQRDRLDPSHIRQPTKRTATPTPYRSTSTVHHISTTAPTLHTPDTSYFAAVANACISQICSQLEACVIVNRVICQWPCVHGDTCTYTIC